MILVCVCVCVFIKLHITTQSGPVILVILCVCVCVFFPSILDIKFVGRTSRGHTVGRSHRIFNPPSFCGACLDFCREKDSACVLIKLHITTQSGPVILVTLWCVCVCV